MIIEEIKFMVKRRNIMMGEEIDNLIRNFKKSKDLLKMLMMWDERWEVRIEEEKRRKEKGVNEEIKIEY